MTGVFQGVTDDLRNSYQKLINNELKNYRFQRERLWKAQRLCA